MYVTRSKLRPLQKIPAVLSHTHYTLNSCLSKNNITDKIKHMELINSTGTNTFVTKTTHGVIMQETPNTLRLGLVLPVTNTSVIW